MRVTQHQHNAFTHPWSVCCTCAGPAAGSQSPTALIRIGGRSVPRSYTVAIDRSVLTLFVGEVTAGHEIESEVGMSLSLSLSLTHTHTHTHKWQSNLVFDLITCHDLVYYECHHVNTVPDLAFDFAACRDLRHEEWFLWQRRFMPSAAGAHTQRCTLVHMSKEGRRRGGGGEGGEEGGCGWGGGGWKGGKKAGKGGGGRRGVGGEGGEKRGEMGGRGRRREGQKAGRGEGGGEKADGGEKAGGGGGAEKHRDRGDFINENKHGSQDFGHKPFIKRRNDNLMKTKIATEEGGFCCWF